MERFFRAGEGNVRLVPYVETIAVVPSMAPRGHLSFASFFPNITAALEHHLEQKEGCCKHRVKCAGFSSFKIINQPYGVFYGSDERISK